MLALVKILLRLLADVAGLVVLAFKFRRSIEAENLFLRRQLVLYRERGEKPRPIDAVSRASLVLLSKMCDWRSCLVVGRPETVVRWHWVGWRLLWRYKWRPGRPRIPVELRQLIRRMAVENSLWGEERIAKELRLKLGISVSPRTVRRYIPKRPAGKPRGDQRWSTYLKNHAEAIVACDFFVAVTATFRIVYVFVVIHHGSRRLLHLNVTPNPTAAWPLRPIREVVGTDTRFRYLLHHRDSIFTGHLDECIENLGLEVLRTRLRSPMANSICERLIGTVHRECLYWLIPLSESHLRLALKDWQTHYNGSRPHMALGG